VLTKTPVSIWALEKAIELHTPEKALGLQEHIQDLDCVITIGYGLLIPEEILAIPTHGFLNLHFSLLPRWRGAAPVQRSIEAQDLLTGVTVFQLDAGMDTGPIFTTHRFALDADITSDELLEELSQVGVGAVLEALADIESGKRPTPQKSEGATRAHKLSREEGKIDWSLSAEGVSAKIRAFTSNPGAWTTLRGQVLKISQPAVSEMRLNIGEIVVVDKKVFIGTGSTALQIGQITPAGKTPIAAFNWANGARLQHGEHCE
jgi:methionyl-tRNA formyltransferase